MIDYSVSVDAISCPCNRSNCMKIQQSLAHNHPSKGYFCVHHDANNIKLNQLRTAIETKLSVFNDIVLE